ncbi:MAG: ABC transporter substrate-binding protein [Chloroflexi bacterium]|jgi:iron(III) transport system substrate-binding protein|nr:ABC transporter substrate-binding protein [Chloroflexota bacterium]
MKKKILLPLICLLTVLIVFPVSAQSGVLNVLCTPQELWCQGMEEAFEMKYPEIDVQWIRLSSGEGLARVQSEAGSPTFDIWWGGPMDSFVAAKDAGLLEQYESPNLKNINPDFYDLFVDKDHYYTGIYMGSLGFMTNTDWLAENPGVEPPKSFEDLLKPEFKGQIVISHPSTAGTAYTFLSTVLQIMGEEKGWEYLKKFNEQVAMYTKSGSGAGKYVASGEFGVVIMFSHDGVKEIENNGAPLVITFPEEGTGFEVGSEAILKGAKNLENAKLWYDWALTPEAQALGAEFQSYQAPTVIGVELSHPELLDVKLIDYDFLWSGEHKQAFQDKFANEIQNAEADEAGVIKKGEH